MSQISLPVADVLTGNWTPTPIFGQVNLPAPDDVHLVTSQTNPQGDTFEVKLAGIAWPDAGVQKLTVRLRLTDAGPLNVTVVLLQDNMPIASQVFQPGQTFSDVGFALTQPQINLITDYTKLRVLVSAGNPVVPCCPNGLPPVLICTATNAGSFNGTYAFIYDPTTQAWVYNAAFGTCSGGVRLICNGSSWVFEYMSTLGWFPFAITGSSVNCDPFDLVVYGVGVGQCGVPSTWQAEFTQ